MADNGCMTQLPDFERLCAGASGAVKAVASFGTALLISGLLILVFF